MSEVSTPSKLEDALLTAGLWHYGQVDKGGEPYILHLISVMLRVHDAGGNEAALVVAILHDAVEDTALTLEFIEQDFGPTVAEAVDALTRRKEETYKQYIVRVSQNPVARAVKIADLQDNLDPKRKANIDIEGSSLERRYQEAVVTLIRAKAEGARAARLSGGLVPAADPARQ